MASSRVKSTSSTKKNLSFNILSFVAGRVSRLSIEASWFVFGALAIFLTLSLISYDPSDSSWSQSTNKESFSNWGGLVGAWLADICLYLMGFSVWWFVILLLQLIRSGYKRLSNQVIRPGQEDLHQRVHWEQWIGFFALLVGSMGLEAIRFYALMKTQLPNGAGGVIGQTLSRSSLTAFGIGGGTLVFLLAFAIGLSLFFKFSWLGVAERVGAKIEQVSLYIYYKVQAYQDRKLGEVALQQRNDDVVAKQVKLSPDHSVRIEPSVSMVPQAVERVVEVKQQTLFHSDDREPSLPALGLLDPAPTTMISIPAETLEFTSRLIEKKLSDFGVSVSVVAAQAGPVITRYEIEPAVGVKGSQIVNLAKDLARALSLVSIRIVETIPGKNLMGFELPNSRRQVVKLSEILGSEVYHQASSKLTLALGKDIAGNPVVADLAKMPHLLVAGTTGSGKSVGINAMILSLLYKASANDVRLILIDPKMLEMSVYEGIPHLLAPVVTDMRQASNALNWCVAEMERRYRLLSHVGVRNLAGYNAKIADAKKSEQLIPNPFSMNPEAPEPLDTLPTIVVVIDELADLMMVAGKKIEELIARLAQKARAAGIHLILATQRPSVDVITGLIKANIPTRIAFQVSSKIDSRTILDQMGAEALLGQGDMLYLPPGTGLPMRVHGAFVTDDEVHRVVDELKKESEPNYIEGILDGQVEGETGDGVSSVTGFGDSESDPLYDQAVDIVLKSRRASISSVQRQLRIGYNRAARLIEQMEAAGLVSSMQSNGNREVLAPKREDD